MPKWPSKREFSIKIFSKNPHNRVDFSRDIYDKSNVTDPIKQPGRNYNKDACFIICIAVILLYWLPRVFFSNLQKNSTHSMTVKEW